MSAMPILDWVNDPVDKLRAGYGADRASISHFSASDVAMDEADFASGLGLRFTPINWAEDSADILYFHGGGWIVGSPWTHQTLCSWMAKLSGRRVFAAPYDLAPERQFPAQADQAAVIANSFTQHRDQIILAGDSAGGAMMLWAEAGMDTPNKVLGLVSLYGAYGGLEGPSHEAYGQSSDGLQTMALRAMYDHLGCEDVSEFRARLPKSGAPLLLVKAECDPVADDNDWLAKNTAHPVTHLLAAGQPHAYLQACGNDRAAEASMQKISEWINSI
tara:strand:+ start:736 stop:1557 length:822 start_codon:yes stop_codon:yes gene_type:complete